VPIPSRQETQRRLDALWQISLNFFDSHSFVLYKKVVVSSNGLLGILSGALIGTVLIATACGARQIVFRGRAAGAAKSIVEDAAESYMDGADKLFSYSEVSVHPTHTSSGRRITYGGETLTEGQGFPTRSATSIRLPASIKTVTATRVQSGHTIQPRRSTGRTMFTAFDQTAAG